MMNGQGRSYMRIEAKALVRMQAKKRALETVSVTSGEAHQPTVVSSADLSDIANTLGAKSKGLDRLSSAQSNAQAITKKALDSATKVVKDFMIPRF